MMLDCSACSGLTGDKRLCRKAGGHPLGDGLQSAFNETCSTTGQGPRRGIYLIFIHGSVRSTYSLGGFAP